MPEIGRNDPCTCGSGKKYKKCCEEKNEAKKRAELDKQWAVSAKEMEKAKEAEEKDGATPSDKPTHLSKRPEPFKGASQKHSTLSGPKFNMPRKSGGGGA